MNAELKTKTPIELATMLNEIALGRITADREEILAELIMRQPCGCFSGVSADASVIITIYHEVKETTVIGSVYSEPFCYRRANWGDAVDAAIRHTAARYPAMFDKIMEAFCAAITEFKK